MTTNTNNDDRNTVKTTVPKLIGFGAGIAALAIAATLALAPKPTTTTVPNTSAGQVAQAETALATVPNVVGLERQHAERHLPTLAWTWVPRPRTSPAPCLRAT